MQREGGDLRRAFAARGFASYSSAIFSFARRVAMDVFRPVHAGDDAALARFERAFLVPYVRRLSRGAGYAVSVVKAG
jgi:5-dehydro-4-deoxyglucarate dehydratase